MSNKNYQISNSRMQYQPNINNKLNTIGNYSNLNINNNSNYNPIEEFKSNNYDTSNMGRGMKINNNFNQNLRPENVNSNINNMNIKNSYNNINNSFKIEENQKGQNQNSGYANNTFRPTPSGERIRQAAASNFF